MGNSEENFRLQLTDAIRTLSGWSKGLEPDAIITTDDKAGTWLMRMQPLVPSACPYELIFKSNRTFGVRLDDQIFDDTPLDDFGYPTSLSYAVANGFVERHELRSALTNQLIAVEMFTKLDSKASWQKIGQARVDTGVPATKLIKRYLPYRR